MGPEDAEDGGGTASVDDAEPRPLYDMDPARPVDTRELTDWARRGLNE